MSLKHVTVAVNYLGGENTNCILQVKAHVTIATNRSWIAFAQPSIFITGNTVEDKCVPHQK